jgi:hypothetical protein
MFDSGNKRVKIIRPGRYLAHCFAFLTGTAAAGKYAYIGPAQNSVDASGHLNWTDATTGFAPGGFTYSFDCALNDYINLCGYTNMASPIFWGAANSTIDVVEAPTW